jgi:hypothetical protein
VAPQIRTEIAKEKPTVDLDPLLWPTDKHKLFPPLFHRAIQLPHVDIFRYAETVKSDPSVQNVWKNAIVKYDASDSSDGEDDEPSVPKLSDDNDGTKPLDIRPQIRHDISLVLLTLHFLEDKLDIPVGAMRVLRSPYRGGVWILSFYSNYEDPVQRMQDEEIEKVLMLLGIPNEELRWWAGVDYLWSKALKFA